MTPGRRRIEELEAQSVRIAGPGYIRVRLGSQWYDDS